MREITPHNVPDDDGQTIGEDDYGTSDYCESDSVDWDLLDPPSARYNAPAVVLRHRRFFLEAIDKQSPRMLEILWDRVFRLGKVSRTRDRGWGSPLDLCLEELCLYHSPSGAGNWIKGAALATLDHWDRVLDRPAPGQLPPRGLTWALQAGQPRIGETDSFRPPLQGAALERLENSVSEPFVFEQGPWDPTTETSDDYMIKTKILFERGLKVYCASIDNMFNYENLPRGETKRDRCPFEWLVAYKFLDRSMRSIAKEKGDNDHTTVLRGIQSAAKLLTGDLWKIWLNHRFTEQKTEAPSMEDTVRRRVEDEDDDR